MDRIQPMGKNHTTEARCPQTPKLQLPGWTVDRCQEEMGAVRASLRNSVQRAYVRRLWEGGVRGRKVGEEKQVKEE